MHFSHVFDFLSVLRSDVVFCRLIVCAILVLWWIGMWLKYGAFISELCAPSSLPFFDMYRTFIIKIAFLLSHNVRSSCLYLHIVSICAFLLVRVHAVSYAYKYVILFPFANKNSSNNVQWNRALTKKCTRKGWGAEKKPYQYRYLRCIDYFSFIVLISVKISVQNCCGRLVVSWHFYLNGWSNKTVLK